MNCNTIYWVKTYHYKVYVMGSLFLKGKAYNPACDILKYICMTPRSCDMHDLRCQCWAHVVDHQGMLAETKHEFYSKDECPTIYIHLWVWTTIKLHTLQFVGVAHQKWEVMAAQFPNMNDATPWWRVMLLEQFWINRDSSCIVVKCERLVVGSAWRRMEPTVLYCMCKIIGIVCIGFTFECSSWKNHMELAPL